MIKIFKILIIVSFLFSCSEENEQIVIKNPFDSTQMINPYFFQGKPVNYCDKVIYTCGYGMNTLPTELIDWRNKHKINFCSYLIKKRNVLKLIALINKTDSFRIKNFNDTWIKAFKETSSKKNEFIFDFAIPSSQICTLFKNQKDSLPLQFDFWREDKKTIKMSIGLDSNVTLIIDKIIMDNRLAKKL